MSSQEYEVKMIEYNDWLDRRYGLRPTYERVVVPKTPFQRAGSVLAWLFSLAAIGSAIWAIVFGLGNWQRGIYGGMHNNDAEKAAINAMIATYGKAAVGAMRFADPPYVNSHGKNALTGTGQVRVIHLIGKEGTRYCITVWGPENNWTHAKPGENAQAEYGEGIDIGAHYAIVRGCRF